MKTRFKFIKFDQAPTSDGMQWFCDNNKSGDNIGVAVYYEPWRQWVFEAVDTAVFSADCLRDIAEFMEGLNSNQG